MHNAEGARLGLGYDYRLFDFDELGLTDSELASVIGRARDEGFCGLNITHPFKERVVPLLDRLSANAEAIGSVNTVLFRPDGIVGHNTDCWGFAESFRQGLEGSRLGDVVLVGAGGAGMAVARALLQLGTSRLAISDLDRGKSERLADSLNDQFGGGHASVANDLEGDVANADGLVNATPIGMTKYPGMPVDRSWLRAALWVADIVYFPAETELLRAAQAIDCRVLPGAGMAVFQAVRAFELLTGVSPDPDCMIRHFKSA